MGGCYSCLRVILEAESDVKINVIEPTTIMHESSTNSPGVTSPIGKTPPQTSGPLLTVPNPHGSFKKPHSLPQ